MILTIDANVFVSDFMVSDVNHQPSRAFTDAVRRTASVIACPVLVLVEITAAIARPSGDGQLGLLGKSVAEAFPGLGLHELTTARAEDAARIAAVHRLRGADAIYVALAQEFRATLVTWDAEMLVRGQAAVSTMTPTDWLVANPVVP